MATRPLDLEWMVTLWNQKRSLGTFQQLLDGNVTNRLTETNPSYQSINIMVPPEQLRRGAEKLAAAADFSGRHFLVTGTVSTPRVDEIEPIKVLDGWSNAEVDRLLASAIFDEASYGRVKFHHRSVREYLAACWVDRLLSIGAPLHHMLQLFVAAPFGTTVLIQNRRWALCWLAAINVQVREWVTTNFPEMITFDGDPESWDTISVDQAFTSYLKRLANGMRTDWYNNVSEYRRVGRKLPSGRVASLFADPNQPVLVKTRLLPYIKHARLSDCAEVVFAMYRNEDATSRDRLLALQVLVAIATPEQVALIKEDILAGFLTSNDLIAAALPVIDWADLEVEQLVAIFKITGKEEEYGRERMRQTIKLDLLPHCTEKSAELLLKAVLSLLPQSKIVKKQFSHGPRSEQPERIWPFHVLADCYEALLVLLPHNCEMYPAVSVDTAEYIQLLWRTKFVKQGVFTRLQEQVEKHPNLRRLIALKIAYSENFDNPDVHLTDPWSCITHFARDDIEELMVRANDQSLSGKERDVWFSIALNISLHQLKGATRVNALATLINIPNNQVRKDAIQAGRLNHARSIVQRRIWNNDSRKSKRESLEKLQAKIEKLLTNIEQIRDGSCLWALKTLVDYSTRDDQNRAWFHADLELVKKDFGEEIADAMYGGLKESWARLDVPYPADFQDGTIPWDAILSLAGLYALIDHGIDISTFNPDEVVRASQLAAWNITGPPIWFDSLVEAHGEKVFKAICPLIINEITIQGAAVRFRRTFELAVRCTSKIRCKLLKPAVPLIRNGQVRNPEVLRTLITHLVDDKLLEPSTISNIYKDQLEEAIGTDGLVADMHWFQTWLEHDTSAAWQWFEKHLSTIGKSADKQLKIFAEVCGELSWTRGSGDQQLIDIIMKLYGILNSNLPPKEVETKGDGRSNAMEHPIIRIRAAIPRVLVRIPGVDAHKALANMASMEADLNRQSWLLSLLDEHSALEAQMTAGIDPVEICTIGSIFQAEPTSEYQLFKQVLGRLEDIQKSIEEGPYSDRDLFNAGIPEKYIQRWLAARFRDTQNRRFSVHREEEVDDENKPDVQLSCAYGNVCVEIKPVDRGRGYSANSLTRTLRTQLVEQYLKGFNSEHGIFVLFRLDNKSWDIPGGAKRQPFAALIKYLNEQADIIRVESSGVQALHVIGIDCTTTTSI